MRDHRQSESERYTKKGISDMEGEYTPRSRQPITVRRVVGILGLDKATAILMLKGAIPPVIAFAAYESDAWSDEYTTLGYTAAIMSILSVSFFPRAKFLQSMFFSVLFACLAAALSLLMIRCCVSARHSQSPIPPPSAPGSSGSHQTSHYNASASTVAGAWMFFYIYLANAVKAKRPQLLLPVIQFCIFILVSSVYAPTFPTMDAGMSYIKRLLKTFLTGFALATGVNLFIVPITSRSVFSKTLTGLIAATKGGLQAHSDYIRIATTAHRDNYRTTDMDTAAAALATNADTLLRLHASVKLELPYARKEVGLGKLTPSNYSRILALMQKMLIPVLGLSTMLRIVQVVGSQRDTRDRNLESNELLGIIHQLEGDEWDEIVAIFRPQYVQLKDALVKGLDHFAVTLELQPRPKPQPADPEKNKAANPGEAGFAEHLQHEIRRFDQSRYEAIREWSTKKDVELPANFWDLSLGESTRRQNTIQEAILKVQNQHQLYLLLYLQYLISATSNAILDTVNYADSLVAEGTMARIRLIFPGWRRLRKLIHSAVAHDTVVDTSAGPSSIGRAVAFGGSIAVRMDPEHLQPTTLYERVTNHMSHIYTFLGSPASLFGLRAACATMSLGMLAYFRQTHIFFLQQRGFWATIMTAISLEVTAGRGVHGFGTKFLGSAIAAVASIAIWYMSDQHAAAIVPLCYVFFVLCIWLMLKVQSLIITGMISMSTVALIVGYELQERKIGLQRILTNGQEYYHVYTLAAYRLASVCAGIGAAAFWTYFPYPITQRSRLRHDTAQTMYLLAEYYSCVHTTMTARLKVPTAVTEENIKGTPLHTLAKARKKASGKTILNLSKLDEHLEFLKFEPPFGGRFPREAYVDLTTRLHRLFSAVSLMSYASASLVGESGAQSPSHSAAPPASAGGKEAGDDGVAGDGPDEWLARFRAFVVARDLTHPRIASALCLGAASLHDARPLPPYIPLPSRRTAGEGGSTAAVSAQSDEVGVGQQDVLSLEHLRHPSFAAFAVLEVARGLVDEEVRGIVDGVRGLCGVVDFGPGLGLGLELGPDAGGPAGGSSNDGSGESGSQGKGGERAKQA